MVSFQLTCKRCRGFIHEEEIYFDQNGIKNMQLGCYTCSHKGYIEYRKWQIFKDKLLKACLKNA